MRKAFLYIFFTYGEINISILKSILLRYNNFPHINYNEIVKKNFKDFLRILFYPFLFLIRFRKISTTDLLFYEMSNAELIEKRRKLFLNKYLNLSVENIKSINNTKFAVSSYKLLFIKSFTLLKHWIIAIFISFVTIFNKGKISISLFTIFNLKVHETINRNSMFIFSIYSLDVYLASLIISKFKEIKISSSNSMVFPYNRYTYLPNVDFILCSKYQEQEIKNFVKNKWLKFKSIERWGLEEVDIYTDDYLKNNQINKFKIGFYSSGEWARIEGLDREFNIDNLRINKHINNPAAMFAYETLFFLIQYCSIKNLKLAVYLHPFERELLNTYGIEPPFLAQIKQNPNIYCSTSANSISNVYEAEIGVSVFSTTIWDRFNFDKIGFLALLKGYEFLINSKYLGEYNQYVYSSIKELEEKLNKEIALG